MSFDTGRTHEVDGLARLTRRGERRALFVRWKMPHGDVRRRIEWRVGDKLPLMFTHREFFLTDAEVPLIKTDGSLYLKTRYDTAEISAGQDGGAAVWIGC